MSKIITKYCVYPNCREKAKNRNLRTGNYFCGNHTLKFIKENADSSLWEKIKDHQPLHISEMF